MDNQPDELYSHTEHNQMRISKPRFEYLIHAESSYMCKFTREGIYAMYDFFDKFLDQIYPAGLDFTRICAEWEETPIFIYQPEGEHSITL
jgi:hypothetical protein